MSTTSNVSDIIPSHDAPQWEPERIVPDMSGCCHWRRAERGKQGKRKVEMHGFLMCLYSSHTFLPVLAVFRLPLSLGLFSGLLFSSQPVFMSERKGSDIKEMGAILNNCVFALKWRPIGQWIYKRSRISVWQCIICTANEVRKYSHSYIFFYCMFIYSLENEALLFLTEWLYVISKIWERKTQTRQLLFPLSVSPSLLRGRSHNVTRQCVPGILTLDPYYLVSCLSEWVWTNV